MAKKKSSSKKTTKKKAKSSKWHAVPLKGSFMVASILGFLFSAYIVYPESINFGVALMVIFGVMFIASLVSMSRAIPKIK